MAELGGRVGHGVAGRSVYETSTAQAPRCAALDVLEQGLHFVFSNFGLNGYKRGVLTKAKPT